MSGMNLVDRPGHDSSQPLFKWESAVLTIGEAQEIIAESRNAYIALFALYLLLVYLLPKYFSNRRGFNLHLFSIIYNSTMSLFSLFGAVALTSYLLQSETLYETYCRCYYYFRSPTILASFLFPLSKPVELIDTFIILLRRRDIIFLHWYHHVITIFIATYNYVNPQPTALYCMLMNYGVHFLMYGYYALMLTSAKRLFQPFSIVITSLQILQMLLAIAIHVFVLNEIVNGKGCDATMGPTLLNGSVYVSFGFLFIQYFIRRYTTRREKSKRE